MERPNLSSETQSFANERLSYEELGVGDLIEIFAIDAWTKRPGSFKIRVVGFQRPKNDTELPAPLFRFLSGRRMSSQRPFHLFGWDRATPFMMRVGQFASPGVSANLVPKFVQSVVWLDGIRVGYDYSFEYIGGTRTYGYAARIVRIRHARAPSNWSAPTLEVEAYLAKIDAINQRNG